MKALRPFLVSLLFRERVCRLALLEMYYNVTKLQLFLLLIMELSACNENVAAGRLEQIMLCWSLTSPNFNTNH